MTGDARARRCAACDRVVHDLSAHTRADAVALLLSHSAGEVCLRVHLDAHDAIVVADGVLADVGADHAPPPPASVHASKWSPPLAAAALGAALAGCVPPTPAVHGQPPPETTPAACASGSAPALAEAPAPSSPPPAPAMLESDRLATDAGSHRPQRRLKGIVVVSQGMAIVTPQCHFPRSSTSPDEESARLLDEAANVLKTHPEIRLVHVEGHASPDERDPQRLSEARAAAVVDELARRGVERARLDARGFGAERPIAPNGSPLDRAKNRRVELRVEPP